MTVPYRILSLLLCLLAAGPMSPPAHALARPENRVLNSFASSLQSASADRDQTLGKSDRFKVDLNDRLLGVGTPARYVYDSNGNATSDTLGTPSTADDVADEYDSENRLARRTVGVPASPAKIIDLRYDADGHRVEKKVTVGATFTTTRYLVDDRNPTGYAQVLEELVSVNGAAETLARTYLYGLDLIGFIDYPSGGGNPSMYYYGYDGLGSVRLLFSGTPGSANAGQVTDVYKYDAFGLLIDQQARNSSGNLVTVLNGTPTPTANNYLYTGEQYDRDLGMYYLRARYYDPNTGRFWTMDSYEGDESDPLSLHKYLYASANPVNNIDPSGHETLSGLMLNISVRVYLAAQTYAPVISAARIGLGALTLGLIAADREFAGIYISSGGNPIAEVNYLYGEIRTLRTALVVARAASAAQVFTSAESAIVNEAKQILGSSEWAQIKTAQAAKQTLKVTINGRTIQYQAGLPFSGMTWTEQNGFIISDEAFASQEEMAKTVAHELHRLTTSTALSRGAIDAQAAARETQNAYQFAEKAAQKLR